MTNAPNSNELTDEDSLRYYASIPHIGIKKITAAPLTRNKWLTVNNQPVDPTVDDVNGYAIVYSDGYISWCPAEVFEESYKPTDKLTYPMALFSLLTGQDMPTVITRPIYQERGEVIILISGGAIAYGINQFYGNPDLEPNLSTDGFFKIDLNTGKTVQWFPTQEDQLATDWVSTYFNVAGKRIGDTIETLVKHPASFTGTQGASSY